MFNKKSRSQLLKPYKKYYELLLMLIPGFVVLLMFNYIPMGGIVIAFKNYRIMDGILKSPWVGFKYFNDLFSGTDFMRILRNTVGISFARLLFGFPAPIILALLLNEMRSITYKRITQTLLYLPHFFSWVVLGGMIIMIFSVSGPFNILLGYLGVGKPLTFFSDNMLFLVLLIGTAVWQGLGWGTVVFMAALSGVDSTLYEAAYIDGAGRLKQVWHISIPSIMPTVVTVLIMNLGHVLNAGFDQIYNMYNPTVYEVAEVLDTYVFRRLQEGAFSYGTAVGLFKSVVGLIFVLGTNYISKKINEDVGIL